MKIILQKYKLLLIGILIGIIYGVLTRVIFGENATLASVTYLFIIPTILGILSLFFANKKQLNSYKNIIFIPWITVASFFLTMYIIGIEEFICLLILAGPFFILGTLGAFIIQYIINHKKIKKEKLLSIVLLPFLFSPIEQYINSPSEIFEIKCKVEIDATSERIWKNIVEVKTIENEEYDAGFFNQIGIPRPINANVTGYKLGANRIGNFEGGLKFIETITKYEPHKIVSFDIKVDPNSVRNNVFDQHVLNGNYFTFVDATYQIYLDKNGKTYLTLSSNYQLKSKINFYGKFWGNIILKDFQNRLLEVIKNRCEKVGDFEING